jgi:FkbM family methyltransferase
MRSQLRKAIVRHLSSIFPTLRKIEVIGSAIFGRVHEKEFWYLQNLIPKNGLVMDVGSNLGQSITSLSVILNSPNIISFECNVNCFSILPKVGYINKVLRSANVEQREFGLGETSGEFTFLVPSFQGLEFLQEGFLEGIPINKSEICERIGCLEHQLELKKMVASIKILDELILNPSLIKIDVQGAEISVLRGACLTIRRCKPVLFIELPDAIAARIELLNFIEQEFDYTITSFTTNCLALPKNTI